ncbi:uncharacterized protein LOC132612700 [Lycium barbarum]|uniref:uncharacterized protein LOC132612700 n=1 Tax=Lycium barbarum TaxID=112863 RepID=UPI00293E4FA8|nr:uncharacterized protein LOC132612700 [Lycium barbarum]
MGKTEIDHDHALYLHPFDTTGAPTVTIQLKGSENYSVWSRAIRIQLLGKNKLGFIDGTVKKEDFEADLEHNWDRCNAIVLGWIMSSVAKELRTGIVYAEDARGIDSVQTYFSKLRGLWAEFDSMVPPPYNCSKSKDFVEHLQRQKLMQFLMGLNESYEQARSHILMTSPAPTVNKAYAMLIERESQRNAASISMKGEGTDLAALMCHDPTP